MRIVKASSVTSAFRQGIALLLANGYEAKSRNGAVLRAPWPVVTEYSYPANRVLVNAVRRPNPFFHLAEAMWMLAGKNELWFLTMFNKRMAEYSDDGGRTQPGAYGFRWRQHFGFDQIEHVVAELRVPGNRRAVLAMYDPITDIPAMRRAGKDIPCNTQIYFIVRPNGLLDMTVTCRSNDIIWGCYGANAVHMSILHEYVAVKTGRAMGTYYQVSNDFHAYLGVYPRQILRDMLHEQPLPTPAPATPLIANYEKMEDFDSDMTSFFSEGGLDFNFKTRWWRFTVKPMIQSWVAYKAGARKDALQYAKSVDGNDWRAACLSWLNSAKQPGVQ